MVTFVFRQITSFVQSSPHIIHAGTEFYQLMSPTFDTKEEKVGIDSAMNASTSGVHNNQVTMVREIEPKRFRTTLEKLPSEMRSRVLFSITDLRILKSLVLSSPTYHEQYKLDRDKLLRNCMESELEGLYVDAFATVTSRVDHLGRNRTNEIITTFLGSYRRWLSGNHDSLTTASNIMSINSSDIRWLCSFHLSVVLPLAEFFSYWAFANLAKAASSSENEPGDEPPATQKMDLSTLSQSERIRIMRALYRCETYYHLFGRNEGRRIGAFRDSQITEIFFNVFEPWEAQKIGCIDAFIHKKYTHVFDEVKADLHPDSPRFDDQRYGLGPEPDGSYELDAFWDGEDKSKS